MELLRLFLVGIVVGIANVIPGVSGGTMVVVFNLYDRFVNVITVNVKKLWASRKFIIPLFGGMAMGVLIFSKLIQVLYSNFPVQTNFAFCGLIIGSMPLIFRNSVKDYNAGDNCTCRRKLTPAFVISVVLCILAGFALIMYFSILEGTVDKSVEASIMPQPTIPLAIKIFIAGILGAVVMIVPGISGSLIMLIMGVYTIVFSSIPELFNPAHTVHALMLLLPNGVGVLIGLLGGAKLISFLLKKIPNHTYAVIFGLLCGSAVVIFPGLKEISGVFFALACILCIVGGFFLSYLSSKFDPEAK